MNDETINNATPAAPETSQPTVADTEVTADVTAEVADKPKQKPAKTGSKPKTRSEAATGANALKAVGLEACRRHGLKTVWVTDDGQCFAQESDALSHGRNLQNHEPLKVTAE